MTATIESNEFKAELVRVLANEGTGFTFDLSNGTVVRLDGKPFDVVTLASVNLSPVGLTLAHIKAALVPFYDIISRRQTVQFYIGLFSFTDKEGDETISVDLNIIVRQAFRANSMAFAKDNNQVAIYDCRRQECIPTGGNGETKIRSVESIFRAAEALVDGRSVAVTPNGEAIAQVGFPQGPGHKWHKTITPDEGPYQYLNRQGQVLGECDHTSSLTAFGECWWKCQGAEGRLANLRMCRQHIENMVEGNKGVA
jgi:hypothetical protein